MRKIIVSEFVSLDGVVENPGWTFPYWNDEIRDFKAEEDAITDSLLLGRVTYEMFAAAWPESEDEGAERMNSMPKYVVSSTLERADWNNTTIIKGNVIESIRALQQGDGQGFLVYGSPTLVQTLIANNMVDSLRLLVYPVVLGEGLRLFHDGTTATLKLVENRLLSGGVAAMVYEPVRE